MTQALVCPNCETPIRVPMDHVGANIACPQCEKLVDVQGPAVTRPEDLMKRTAPGGRQMLATAPAEVDEDLRPMRKSFKACPRCGSEGAKRVLFTPWGSFYGPALFNHVRCPECRYAYNGRSGGSNLIPAVLFVVIPLVLMAGILSYVAMLVIPHL